VLLLLDSTSLWLPSPWHCCTASKASHHAACAGKGRGIFTTAAVAAGDLLLVAQPLALLYCEEGATPENEELADALAAAVAATTAAAAAPAASGSGGLALWQQHALLQLTAAGEGQDGAGAEQQQQQQQLLLQLLGDPADVAAAMQHVQPSSSSSSSSSEEADKQQQQQQQQQVVALAPVAGALPSADRVLQIVHANCTGEQVAYQHRPFMVTMIPVRPAVDCGGGVGTGSEFWRL
jgi:hypothetical protein